MRTGSGEVQQALAAEAADVMSQAVSLARRRGHAQVTPLHVASAMLSAAGLLRAACLHSYPHPLQCKALELCFNVALNSLPTAAAKFHNADHHAPALSNALVAACKRSRTRQRRGSSAEGQQHPAALVVKVELEQLIISILDDPSVSRVMRAAGLSSSQVKANVEKAVSNTASSHCTRLNLSHNIPEESKATSRTDEAMRVLDCMASGRKRCVVVVGESAATAEGVVKSVMDKVSKGELQRQHECLKNLRFVPLLMVSFQRMTREEVKTKAGDLRALVCEGCAAGKGVVLFLEDLNYAAEAWAAALEKRRRGRAHGHYCPVEHAVMEVSSLVRGGRGDERLCLLGFGTYPSYTNCRAGQPSLAAVWELHPIVVPDGGHALSLQCDSEQQASETRSRTALFVGAAAGDSELTFCGIDTAPTATTASLPWSIRRYQDPVHARSAICGTTLQLQDLCNSRWNSTSNGSSHRSSNCGSELTLSFSSSATASPAASPISGFTNNCFINLRSKPWSLPAEPRQPWPNHRRYDPMAEPHHQPSHANRNPDYSTSACNSSDKTTEAAACRRPKFTGLTAENLKILCSALEMRVPRHKDIVPDIASTLLLCRSGMVRRMGRRGRPSSVTWLIFQGRDSGGKKAMAQEIAKLVFGSYAAFTSITIAEFTPVNSDCSSSGELTLKTRRSPDSEHCYMQKLYEAIRDNPHRVMMIAGVEKLDYDSEIGIKKAIAVGRIRGCNGDEISLEDAIVVLTCEVFDSRSRASLPRVMQRVIREDGSDEDGKEKEVKPHFSLDLNACTDDGEEKKGSPLHEVEILNIVDGVFFFQLTDG